MLKSTVTIGSMMAVSLAAFSGSDSDEEALQKILAQSQQEG